MILRSGLILLFSLALTLPNGTTRVHASPIDELSYSNQYQSREALKKRYKSLEDRPNLKRLFDSTRPTLMENWLGVITTGFKPGRNSVRKREDDRVFVYERHYFSEAQEEIVLAVYIPLPISHDLVELNLLKTISSLEPPQLSVRSSQEVELRGRTAFIYQHSEGGCSLNLKLLHGAVVHLSTSDCQANQTMLNLASRFDFSRLEQKIGS